MFRKVNLLTSLIFVAFFSVCIFAQIPPPEVGRYACITTQLSNAPGATLGSVIFIPAVFGDVVLDGKGNYQLPGLKTSGLYKFDKATSKLTFTTGDLRALIASRPVIYNGRYRFILPYKSIAYECSNQTVSNQPDTKPNIPSILNKGLKGNMLVSTSNRYLGYGSLVYRIDLATGRNNLIFPNGVGIQNNKGEILYFDNESRLKITDQTGNSTIKQLTDRSTVNFDDLFPAFSNSGEYYALTLPATVDSGIFAGIGNGGNKVVIFNRNGNKKGEFTGFIQAAWMPNSGLIVAGEGGNNRGLFIIDANFKTIKKLVEGFETAQMPAVSPDGKQVAFVNKGEIWTIGIDGTNPKVAILGGASSFPTWSPDGKYIAAVVRTVPPGEVISKNIIFIAKFNTTEGFFLVDQANKAVPGGNKISWLSDTPISATTVNNQTNPTSEPKVSADSVTAYQPTQTNKDPNFAKANAMYRQVMGDDLENYNDMAAALTYIVVLNYTYLHQLDGVPTNHVRKVYQQFVEKLSQIDGFKNANNETKEQFAEKAILDGLQTLEAVNSKNSVKIKETSLRLLKQYLGNSADKLKITENGMEF